MKKCLIFITLIFVLALPMFLVGCLPGTDEGGEDEYYKVMLSYGEGVTVESENPVMVKRGDSAVFKISFGSTYVFDSLDIGSFEEGEITKDNPTRNGEVRIDNITGKTNASIAAVDLGYKTTDRYQFSFSGAKGDKVSLKNNSFAYSGTQVYAEANDQSRKFIGWSFGAPTTDKTKMASVDRNFEFRLNHSMLARDGYSIIELYANYVEADTYYYNLNGGALNPSSPNMTYKEYYVATKADSSSVSVAMKQSFMDVCESVSLFYDDGSFTRDGYVLTEYNTEPDGSGEAYSLGSMYFIDEDNPVLYCIWQKATPDGDFTYEKRTNICPFIAEREPGWQSSGVYITGYTGNDQTVVIPEKIGDEYVIGIKSGAFRNKSMDTLVFSRFIRAVEDGAFIGCSSLNTVYYSDAIYNITDDAFDSATYLNLHNFYVNATMAPRFSNSNGGSFSVKLSRILASMDKNRIIVIAGSSVHLGLSSTYMEALFENQYTVVNFGTTRTINCTMFLEAMGELTHEGDIVVYAPENSSYMVGEREIYWKTLRDIESMYNIFRHIDMANYSGILSAFGDYNQNWRLMKNAGMNPTPYEIKVPMLSSKYGSDKFGDSHGETKGYLQDSYYGYYITFNERFKSKDEGNILSNENLENNKDYNDPNNITWTSIDEEYYTSVMNKAIAGAKRSGAKVYFGYCPADANAVVEAARNDAWLRDYEDMIKRIYTFDAYLGSVDDHIYAHEYFYDSSFHLNDVGRTYHTYQLYTEICGTLGKNPRGFRSAGTDFKGCIFEQGSNGVPLKKVDWLS